MATAPENMNEVSYGRTEQFLRSSCLDNAFRIPEEFQNWRLYFWSRGSYLREWSRWLGEKLIGRTPKIDTDMTPHKDLERKIKERRAASGKPGGAFRSLEQKVAHLRGESHVASTQPKKKSKSAQHWVNTPWTPPAPVLPKPSGMEGSEHHIH